MRDKKTGKPKGFCFIAYEDQRSTILAVDNFNGTKVLPGSGRVRVRVLCCVLCVVSVRTCAPVQLGGEKEMWRKMEGGLGERT